MAKNSRGKGNSKVDEVRAARESKDQPKDPASRAASLKKALEQIEKNHGEGSIMRFTEMSAGKKIEVIPVGAPSIDHALGIGGFPRGRIIEVFGPESSGKTTLALHAVASAQRAGGVAAYIDAEHAMDPIYCRKLGVNMDEMLISQPDFGEQALDIVETLVESNSVDIIVVDSVAALVPKAEIEGEMGESFVGLQARLMSQALRKLTGAINRSKCVVIFINQIREKVGVMFGSPETTPGGRALKFFCSMRVDIRRIGAIKDGDKQIGSRARVKIVKNKMAPPFREAEFDIMFGEGISVVGDLLDMAVAKGIVKKSGAWFTYGEAKLGQGRENSKGFLQSEPKLLAEIDQKVRTILTEGSLPAVMAPPKGGKKGSDDAAATAPRNGASVEEAEEELEEELAAAGE